MKLAHTKSEEAYNQTAEVPPLVLGQRVMLKFRTNIVV